eukprot:TRINITY_DN36626_c0_g2_i2.p1 TRINITY_DN36626_c0_g2~~TRINITY_DN36626_c0_g2_i2.p1  ORF type:complete len:254 (-),score=46.91 TRINITY_DN36626_c0_g2_i2:288-1049(-)
MPFNVKCLGCNAMIGKGVRFNAKKDHAGNYFSTKIWKFSMTCHHCHHPIVVSTDPKNSDYALTAGLERKHETYDAAEAGTAELMSADERERIAQDPFTNLEHKGKLEKEAARAKPILSQLQGLSKERWGDSYDVNRALRRKFRGEKTVIKRDAIQRDKDIARAGVPLLPLSIQDQLAASKVEFTSLGATAHQQSTRSRLLAGSIFARPAPRKPTNVAQISKHRLRLGPKLAGHVVTPSAISKRVLVTRPKKPC